MRLAIPCLLLLAARASAGPPPFSHFDIYAFQPARDGRGGGWLVGVDSCDEGGMTDAAVWVGARPRPPESSPVGAPVQRGWAGFAAADPAAATIPAALRATISAIGRTRDAATLWAVGQAGAILVSVDAGQHWRVQASHTALDLFAVWVQARDEVYAIGSAGAVFVARDGKPWTAIPGLQPVRAAWGIADDRYLAGVERTYVSHDRGRTWAVAGGADGSLGLLGIGGASVGEVYGWGFGRAVVTRDRGKTWDSVVLTTGHPCS